MTMRPSVTSPLFLLFALLFWCVLDSCSVFQTPQASTGDETATEQSAGTRPSNRRGRSGEEGSTPKSSQPRPSNNQRRRADQAAESSSDAKPISYSYSTMSSTTQQDYIKTYKDAAVMEMNRGGIPASIILAQGLIESAAGQSDLAQNANNHFGIKCAGGWTGRTFYKQDDDRDADGKPIKSCFRVYNSVFEGFHDHGEFLRDPKKYNRYGFLFNLDKTDYKSWARGLQSAGYATSQTYATQLIGIIERFKIYEYDRPNATAGVQPDPATPKPTGPNGATPPDPINPNVPVVPPAQRIGRVNDVKVVLTRPGETLDDIAKLYRLNTLKVADYNDRGHTPGLKLKENTRIFIQAKRERWRGRANEHFVRDDQMMFDISQLYGIQLKKLLDRNGLSNGQEPASGEKIMLKGARRKGDNVVLRDASNVVGKPANPNPTIPVAQPPNPGKNTVNDDELFEINGNQSTTQPPATKPAPTPSFPGTKPATSDVPYPSDPIPQPGNGGMQPAPTVTPPAQPAAAGYHLVVKGDTLFNVSRKYNLSVERLKQMNNMTDNNIRLGQTLRVR